MLQGRRLCKISLLLIIISAFSVYGPWDFLGVYAKANAASACLSDGMVVQATGYVYHKEIKNDDVVYYVKNATLNCEKGRLNQTSFIFKFDSDNIPNYCKLNIEGTVSSFMEARNEGGFDGKNYYQSMGLYFQLKDVKVLECKSFLLGGEDLLYRLRQSISNVYKWALPGEEAGFLSSITIGNKGDLLGDLKTLFQLVGVAHVLAVSGLHVSVICMAMYRGFRKRGISFLTSGIVGGIVAVLYGVLTGGSVSSVRAIGMFLVFILADILGESYDSLTALFFLADILIFINPLYLKNGSFIFSFSAIFGILFVSLPLNRMYMEYCNGRQKLIKSDDGFGHVIKKSWKRRLVEWFCSSLIFSIGIYVSMLPLVSYMYYETPVYSVFSSFNATFTMSWIGRRIYWINHLTFFKSIFSSMPFRHLSV